MDKKALAEKIEHTILKATVTEKDIETLCKEALDWKFYGVCVNSVWLDRAHQHLKGSPVHLISVAGFPLGASATLIKCREIEYAFSRGASEVDFVLNLGWVKAGNYPAVKREFTELMKCASNKPLKVILENCMLTDEEKGTVCRLALEAGLAFVKTSTGFAHGGATVEDVKLMKSVVDGKVRIKAAGSIRDIQAALSMVAAGADRIGTSSGVSIMQEVGTEYTSETY